MHSHREGGGWIGVGSPQEGQSLVEFSFAAVVLILLIFGAVDLGLAYINQISLRGAAREGAIYGSIAPTDEAGIRARVKEASDNPIDLGALPDEAITIEVISEACAGNLIRVRVESQFRFITPFLYNRTIRLRSEATNSILTPACQAIN